MRVIVLIQHAMSGLFSKTHNCTNVLALGLLRMTVLLLVCLTQSWLLWKFIRFQLRRWREFRHEQAVRKKTATKQTLRPLKRDSREYKHHLFNHVQSCSIIHWRHLLMVTEESGNNFIPYLSLSHHSLLAWIVLMTLNVWYALHQ